MYQTNSIIKPVKGMIESCPFLSEFKIFINPIGYEEYPNEEGKTEQAFLDTGTADITGERITIDGVTGVIFKRIVSFMFLQDKAPEDSSIVDFRTNIIEWIAWLNENGQTPKFSHMRNIDGSMSEYIWNNEKMWATNAAYIGKNEAGISVYNVDIHVRYMIKYESIGRCW